MVNPCSSVSKTFPRPEHASSSPRDGSFGRLLSTFLDNVNTANLPNHDLECGRLVNTHQQSIMSAKSDVMLHLVTQLAQKISSATTTLMQMQI